MPLDPATIESGLLAVYLTGAFLSIIAGNALAIAAGASWRELGLPRAVGVAGVVLGAIGLINVPATYGWLATGIAERISVYTFLAWALSPASPWHSTATRSAASGRPATRFTVSWIRSLMTRDAGLVAHRDRDRAGGAGPAGRATLRKLAAAAVAPLIGYVLSEQMVGCARRGKRDEQLCDDGRVDRLARTVLAELVHGVPPAAKGPSKRTSGESGESAVDSSPTAQPQLRRGW